MSANEHNRCGLVRDAVYGLYLDSLRAVRADIPIEDVSALKSANAGVAKNSSQPVACATSNDGANRADSLLYALHL